MSVIVMKLTNGDEVIANMSDKSETQVFVDRPRVIFTDGERGGLMPYFISTPDAENVGINRSSIVSVFEAPIDLAKEYTQSTSRLILG